MPPLTIPAPRFSTDLTRAMLIYGGANFAWNAYKYLSNRPSLLPSSFRNGWRPFEWTDEPQFSIIDKDDNVYVFDAILRIEHLSSMRLTEHPVQNGASVIDHSYQLPEQLTFEVGMSDAMDSYTVGQWNEYETKSISAFQKIKDIQYARQPVVIVTRLNIYENMIIEQVSTPDDHKTLHGLRCTVNARQLISAKVGRTTVKVSSKIHTTNLNPKGVTQTEDVNASTIYKLSKKAGIE